MARSRNKKHNFDEDDKLDLKSYSVFLKGIIENSSNYRRDDVDNGFIIALDAKWGSGKSFFLEMFEEELKQTQNIALIHYNSWENDFWENAYEPFIHNLMNSDEIKGYNGAIYDTFQKMTSALKVTFKGILESKAAASITYETIKTILTELKTNTEVKYEGTDINYFDRYSEYKEKFVEFKEKLLEFSKTLSKEKIILLIIIDELDRCRPQFALETLEIAKHIFNMENVVFLFAADLEQLGYTVAKVNGYQSDYEGYLQKFFTYKTMLPAKPTEMYIKHKLEKSNRFKAYQDDNKMEIINCIVRIVSDYNLTMRDIDTYLMNYMVLIDFLLKDIEIKEQHKLYLSLLVMKYKRPKDYNALTYDKGALETIKFCSEAIKRKLHTRLSKIDFSSITLDNGYNDGIVIYIEDVLIKDETINIRFITEFHNIIPDLKTMSKGDNLDGILYYSDLLKWEKIQNLKLIEYYIKNLECFFE